MFHVVYKVKLTEFERGMGQRPDGTVYAFDLPRLQAYIEKINSSGNSEIFTRAGSISSISCTDALAKKINEYGGLYETIRGDDPGELTKDVA